MPMVRSQTQGGISLVRFDRGSRANALSADLMAELADEARKIALSPNIRAVVLTGAASIFAGGVDLNDTELWKDDAEPVERLIAMSRGGDMVEAWRRVPQPVIAAVEGPAIGGGAILALAADFRVMGTSAYIRFPEVKLGMTLGWGGLSLLVERVGSTSAKRILFADERISAGTARDGGLCDRIAEDGTAVDVAMKWCEDLAALPPAAVRMTKASIDAYCRQNWASGYEADQFFLARRLSESASG